jgi:UMF1 family MFS transporter
MARLAPTERRGEFFGLFALSGKATAFAGPILVAIVTSVSGSQRAGLASTLIFFLLGLTLLAMVQDPMRHVIRERAKTPREVPKTA